MCIRKLVSEFMMFLVGLLLHMYIIQKHIMLQWYTVTGINTTTEG